MYPLFSDALPYGRYAVDHNTTLSISTRRKKLQDGLFADDIWPGAILMSNYLRSNPILCADKNVIELGAGGALPSLVSMCLFAKFVVISDFPDITILENIFESVKLNKLDYSKCKVKGLKWGDPLDTNYTELSIEGEWNFSISHISFDLVILAEVLWKDTYPLHSKLLQTLVYLSKSNPRITILLSFAHRPTIGHDAANDMEFLYRSKSEYNFNFELISSVSMPDVCESDNDCINVFLYKLWLCDSH